MAGGKPKVLVAMSGGVDSSVAAALLQRAGYEVVGCFMRLGSPGETLDELIPACEAEPGPQPHSSGKGRLKIGHQGCCSINDAADARLVAAGLDVPFYVCNFKKDFGRIIDYFVDEYAAGRTPNPCVRCNDWLKFGKLHEYAKQIGADFVASGHYARVEDVGGEKTLLRGVDHSKDQSYVLFGVPRAQLGHMLLPIGGLQKTRVRELAREFGLPVFDKPDSQEICFVPDNDYAGLVERRRPAAATGGKIVDSSGAAIGEHSGQHRFTIGQRRGLDVSLGHRVYVVGKDAATNTVTVGSKEDLLCAACTVGEANWLIDVPGGEMRCWAKYRYNTPACEARVRIMGDAETATPSGRIGRFEVTFDEPQEAVAAGQAIVLYSRGEPDRVLGGGWVLQTIGR
jgi:tRNA-specific 2-thiouridylase